MVEQNHVARVMQELRDGGGTYFGGVMGGPNTITGNVVEHVGIGPSNTMGIYLDDHCDGVSVTDNVVVDAGLGFHLHGASRDVLENNVVAFSRMSDISIQPEAYNVAPMDSVLRHNIFYDCSGPVFADRAPWEKKPLGECDDNLYWRNGNPVAIGQGTFAGFDRHSLVADPKFIDAAEGNFELRSDSPALGLGISSFDPSGAGPAGSADAVGAK